VGTKSNNGRFSSDTGIQPAPEMPVSTLAGSRPSSPPKTIGNRPISSPDQSSRKAPEPIGSCAVFIPSNFNLTSRETDMRAQTARTTIQHRGREAIDAGRDALVVLRGRTRKFAAANLPKAASAAESAGETLADFALSSSRSLAKSMRSRGKALGGGTALLQAAPLLRTAGRFALRNPALIALAGAGVAILGYAAWRRQRDAQSA
jgi:hypothetical protein